ncbi:MAG: hypothetical protein KF832_11605 [Caldilineaceae bacterium]|nr:hypothetical protein [Caldilineaceae bacterium]
MSISPIIDEHYRLHPADLGRRSVQVTIQNVSWQGVEQLRPLLHLREFPQKRLPLNSAQVQRLVEIVGSSLAQDWIGHTILLLAEREEGDLVITLQPFMATPGATAPTRLRPQRGNTNQTALLVLLLALLFGLVFLLDRVESLWTLFGR